MRVIVVGGRGHLGARAVAALRRLPGGDSREIIVAGRRGPLRIDLAEPSTFDALAAGDLVIDVADSTGVAPDALARYCLDHGITFLEASSDAVVVDRLTESLRGASGEGAVILGAGIFTGLSNLLASRAVRDVANAEAPAASATNAAPVTELVLGISTSPFSAAGGSTVRLMGALLGVPARSWAFGRRVLSAPIGPGQKLPFPCGKRPSLRAALAEPDMLHESLGVPDISVFLALRPGLLCAVFLALPNFLVRSAFFAFVTRFSFTVLRRVLLARTITRVEMVALARGADGVTKKRTLVAEDGMRAGGVAIAAIAAVLVTKTLHGLGLRMIDQVVDLDEVMEKIRLLGAPGEIVLGE